MKGPMATQTLVGIVGGTEPFHWRGDREDLAAFNPAFEGLQGDDAQLNAQEMAQFTSFIATLTPPPNPFRGLDNSLPTTFPNGGNAQTGQVLFNTGQLDAPFECSSCHPQPFGTDNRITSNELDQQTQSMNAPHLLNLYEKTGFEEVAQNNNRGFGYVHDGSFDTLFNFLGFGFNFQNAQQRRDVEAYLMSFSVITHAGVGAQATLPAGPGAAPTTAAELVALASGGAVGLVVKGVVAGEARGYHLVPPTTFQSDRAGETTTLAALAGGAGPGAELTFTLVPSGSEVRIGVDRDCDGFFDRDELDAGSDPADPASTPETPFVFCTAKVNSQGCTPGIAFAGVPSETLPTPFDVSAAMVLNQRNGLLFYAYDAMAGVPFLSGTLCAQPPLRRLPIQSSGGTPPPVSDCSGTYLLDVNALIQSGVDPFLVVGQVVVGQWWSRDPAIADGSGAGLTDAVHFVIGP